MKRLVLLAPIALGILFSMSSCFKKSCVCEAEGYASQSELQRVLDRYGKEGCLDVVSEGGYRVDYTGIELYCREE